MGSEMCIRDRPNKSDGRAPVNAVATWYMSLKMSEPSPGASRVLRRRIFSGVFSPILNSPPRISPSFATHHVLLMTHWRVAARRLTPHFYRSSPIARRPNGSYWMHTVVAPYGRWTSPISSEVVSQSGLAIGDVSSHPSCPWITYTITAVSYTHLTLPTSDLV